MNQQSNRPDIPHIAVVCDYSLGYLGGAQTALLQESAALVAAGASVVMFSPSPPGVWERVRPTPDVDHVRIPARFTLPGLDLPVVPNSARLRRRLAEQFTGRSIDVVHLQSEFGLAAAAITVAAELGLPVVHTVHTFYWRAPDRGQALISGPIRGFHRLITRLPSTTMELAERPADSALRNMTLTVARRADLVLSGSAHQALQLRRAGLDHVEVLPNTVSVEHEVQPLATVQGPLKIIWIGRCAPEKRILPFVRAAATSLDQIGSDKIDFTVVGDGPQLAEASAIAELLADAHLAVLTSYGFDNQPMTVVEAVMSLRGVVYCDPALSEGLDGPGILAPEDPAGLAGTFCALARQPERVVAASRAAVAVRAGFDPQRHATELIKHCRRLIAAETR